MILKFFIPIFFTVSLYASSLDQSTLTGWINLIPQEGFDYLLILVTLTFIITGLFLIYRYRVAHNYNQHIKKYLDVIDKNILISSGDINGTITDISEALCKTSGYTKEELIGQNHTIFRDPDTPKEVYKEMWENIQAGKPWDGELRKLKKDGTFFWVDAHISPIFSKDGSIEGYSIINQDITDKKYIEELSVTDQLTQISNRLALQNTFDRELDIAKRHKKVFSIILLDVDDFKLVNDTFGHHAGDITLIKISSTLKKNIRNIDVLGRWGGEEFLIICHETDAAQAHVLAEKLRKSIEGTLFETVGSQTCSFGISQYRSDDKSSNEIINRADKALYEAKRCGKNTVKTLL